MELKESGEMYLESIYLLIKKNSNVRSVDVATFLGYSKPSVSRAVGVLKSAGLIFVTEEGYIRLTDNGQKVAEQMYERHTLLTELFIRLGVPEEIASADACKIEHVISDTTFQALKSHSVAFMKEKDKR